VVNYVGIGASAVGPLQVDPAGPKNRLWLNEFLGRGSHFLFLKEISLVFQQIPKKNDESTLEIHDFDKKCLEPGKQYGYKKVIAIL